MKGTFKTEEGETILVGVEISLTTKGGSHSLNEWFGSFRTKRQHDFEVGEYQLELAERPLRKSHSAQRPRPQLLVHRQRTLEPCREKRSDTCRVGTR